MKNAFKNQETEALQVKQAPHVSINQQTPTFSDTDGKKFDFTITNHESKKSAKNILPVKFSNNAIIAASPQSGETELSQISHNQNMDQDVRKRLHLMLKNSYQIAQKAFAEFDFKGQGVITFDQFLSQHAVKKAGFKQQFIRQWLLRQLIKLGQKNNNQMSLDDFKKIFFPYQAIKVNQPSSASKKDSALLTQSKASAKQKSKQELRRTEQRIKEKIVRKFQTVRKAFLTLDYNFDGFIVAQDIIRLFISDNQHLEFETTEAILRTKGAENGKIDFAQFCSWVGRIIQPNHGVYQPPLGTLQTHNIPPPPAYLKGSQSNPNLPPFIRHSHNNFVASFYNRPQIQGNNDKKDIKKIFIKKLFHSSKSLKKGFFQLSDTGNGIIDLDRMKQIFQKWGFDFPQNQVIEFFNQLDQNKDGQITFAEFQKCLGQYIMPQQTLYFRQQYDKKYRPTKCIYQACWDSVSPNSRRFCQLHSQLSQNKAKTLIKKLPQLLGHNWDKLIDQIEIQARANKSKYIDLMKLEKLLKNMGKKLDSNEIDCILELCQDKKHEGAKRVQIDPFLRVKSSKQTQQPASQSVKSRSFLNNFNKDSLNTEEQQPFGANIHTQKNFIPARAKKFPLEQNQLLALVRENNLLAQVNTRLRKMDQQHSGLATAAQIQRIFSDSYPELQYYDFKSAIKKYQLQHNKMLFDYRKLMMFLSQKASSSKSLAKKKVIPSISKSYERLPPNQLLRNSQQYQSNKDELSQNQILLTPNVVDRVLGMQQQNQVSDTQSPSPLQESNFRTIEVKRSVSPFNGNHLNQPKRRAVTPVSQRRNSQFVGNVSSQEFHRDTSLNHMKRAFEQTSPDPYITPSLRRYQKIREERKNKVSKSPDDLFKRRNHSVSLQPHSLTPKPSAQYLRNQERQQQSSKQQDQKVKRLKQKLFKEWKIINRSLISQDLLGTGSINRQDLQRIIYKAGIYIDRDEWRIIFAHSRNENSFQINIKKLSDFIGIPSASTGFTKRRNEKMINKLALLRANKSNIWLKRFNNNNASTISAALTERIGMVNDPAVIKKRIQQNWRDIYEVLKKKFGASGYSDCESFKRILKLFGIQIKPEQLEPFLDNQKVNFREFLRFYIGKGLVQRY